MKKLLFTFLMAAFGMSAMAQKASCNVLWIGNSYTEVNSLPSLVESIFRSQEMEYSYRSNTPGGCTFRQHCTNESMALIGQGGWDFVVLQEQSQYPSFPQNQVENEVFPYAAQLVAEVYRNNPDGEAMFYMTWGRKDGDQQNAQYFPVLGTYEGMDSMLYERYLYMARANDASVCPVGRVWRYLRSNYPEIELYQGDGSHPSMAGSYAAACAFFTMFTERDPETIRFDAGLDAEVAHIIREAVHTVVYDNIEFWQRQQEEPPVAIDEVQASEIKVFPNPTTGIVHAEGMIEVADLNGRILLRSNDSADLSGLENGIYVIRVMRGGVLVASQKIIKI